MLVRSSNQESQPFRAGSVKDGEYEFLAPSPGWSGHCEDIVATGTTLREASGKLVGYLTQSENVVES